MTSEPRWSADILYLQSYRCSTEGGSRRDAARFPGFAHTALSGPRGGHADVGIRDRRIQAMLTMLPN